MEVLFASDSEYSIGEYHNQEVDSLLQAEDREQGKGKSFELYQQVEQIIVSEAAGLLLWSGNAYVLVKPYVKGYSLNLLGYVILSKVYVK